MPQPLEEVFRADFDSLCSFASSSDGLGLEMEPAQAWARELIRENLRGRDTSRPAGQFSESVQAKYHILYEFAQSYSGLGMPYDEAREWALKNLKRQIHTNIFKGYYDIGYEFAYYQLDWSSDESRNFALQYSEGKCRTIRLDNTNTDLSSWHAIARGIMERALEIEENRLEIERRVLRTAADLYHTVYKQARAPGWQGGRGFSDENAKQYAKSEMLRVISR
jgi:hypothetical protein